jgi:hypothetical protein
MVVHHRIAHRGKYRRYAVYVWRRRRDSNPRDTIQRPSGFRDRPLQPTWVLLRIGHDLDYNKIGRDVNPFLIVLKNGCFSGRSVTTRDAGIDTYH